VSGRHWDHNARNLHFGVREHAMGGMLNGLALSRAIIPFGGTFLIFSDYMRAAMRLAAIMKLQVVYVLTHDSIGQGEDGTTHQPVEQLAALRAMPNMTVIRPADATETTEAWRYALDHTDGPTALSLTRQKLPVLDRKKLAEADNLKYGGYVLQDCKGTADIILIATGSEVHITLEAADELTKQGVKVRVVSMPSTDLFDAQPQKYRDTVLPPKITKRLAVEAASPLGWDKYVGPEGGTITIDKFGESAPGPVMMEKFGFTPANIVNQTLKLLGKKS
jgi:transketolase